MAAVELCPPLPFTKNMRVLRRPHQPYFKETLSKHLLFDLETDPLQMSPLNNPKLEQEIVSRLKQNMIECHAPQEMFVRYGIEL